LPLALLALSVGEGSEPRRRGIGRALMDQAIGIARQAGCYKLFLGSNVKRADAHEFYRALGFHVHGPVFRMDL